MATQGEIDVKKNGKTLGKAYEPMPSVILVRKRDFMFPISCFFLVGKNGSEFANAFTSHPHLECSVAEKDMCVLRSN